MVWELGTDLLAGTVDPPRRQNLDGIAGFRDGIEAACGCFCKRMIGLGCNIAHLEIF